MKVSEIKTLIETSASLRDDLSKYISDYVKWVEKNVPAGMEGKFGVGITSDNRFGTYWGFWNEDLEMYTCTGSSWYVGNDWNCKIVGSSVKQQRNFSKKIPQYIASGLDAIKKENEEIEELLKNKLSLD